MSRPLVICNGPPKSGTHALLQSVEVLGYAKHAFVKALGKDACYARPIDYGADSVFLSREAKAKFDRYVAEAPTHRGVDAVRAFLGDAPAGSLAHAHISWRRRDLVAGHRVITILRNPRDTFISWMRWFGPKQAAAFFPAYRSFTGWRKADLVIYETLFEPGGIEDLAAMLGVPCDAERAAGVVAAASGRSLTWSNRPSDHAAQWNPGIEQFWHANGGPRLDRVYAAIRAEKAEGRIAIAERFESLAAAAV